MTSATKPRLKIRLSSVFNSLRRALTPDRIAAGIFVLGALLRFYRLGSRSFWLDEFLDARTVRLGGLSELLRYVHSLVDQMPLHNILIWLVGRFGGTEWLLRLPSALAGSFGVLAVYVLAKSLGRPRAGLAASAFLAVSSFSVWYSQDARPYALLMLLTTLQMLFAWRAIRLARRRDWLLFTLCSILNLYNHLLALFPSAAAWVFIGIGLLAESRGRAVRGLGSPPPEAGNAAGPPVPAARPRPAAKWGAALLSGALLTAALYVWLPYLRAFLNRGDLSGRAAGNSLITWTQGWRLLRAMSISQPLASLIAVGIAVLLIDAFRRRWRETLLIALWLGVPLGGLWLRSGGGNLGNLLPRYLSFLFPALILLAGIGMEGISAPLRRLPKAEARPRRKPVFALAAWRAGIGIVLILTLTRMSLNLALTYRTPKDDYRGAAEFLLASSPPGSAVIGLGSCSHFFGICLPYYFWLRHGTIPVFDGERLDGKAADHLGSSKGTVWGAVSTVCFQRNAWEKASQAGLEIIPFRGMVLLRLRGQEIAPLEQAFALLRWGSVFRPELLSSIRHLEVLSGRLVRGGNLLASPVPPSSPQAPGPWSFGPGASLAADRSSFVLRPGHKRTGREVNVTAVLSGEAVAAGRTFLFSCDFRNPEFRGEQRVYISAHGPQGEWLDVFPDGAGYLCPPAPAWASGAFAFTVPEGAVSLQVWLRATGSGAAEFKNAALRPYEIQSVGRKDERRPGTPRSR